MSDDESTSVESPLMVRVARLVAQSAASGLELGPVPRTPTLEWLEEKEALIHASELVPGEGSELEEESEPELELEEESEPELELEEESEPELESASAVDEEDFEGADTDPGVPAPRSEEAPGTGRWDVFRPGNGEVVGFALYTANGLVWSSVMALELVGRHSIDGVRGALLLSVGVSFFLNLILKRRFARPDDQSGPAGKTRFFQDGISIGLVGFLGTMSGVTLGLAFSPHGAQLAETFGLAGSVVGALGITLMSLATWIAVRGSLAVGHGESAVGAGILGVAGTALLVKGAVHIMSIKDLVDQSIEFKERWLLGFQPVAETPSPLGESVEFTADILTMAAVSDTSQQVREFLQEIFTSSLALGSILLGVGLLLGASMVKATDSTVRLKRALKASAWSRRGLTLIASGLGLGTLIVFDATFLHIGGGWVALHSQALVLSAFLLIPAVRSTGSARMHMRKGLKFLKEDA